MSTEEGDRLRNEARIKYAPQLRRSFKMLDADRSGFASVGTCFIFVEIVFQNLFENLNR
jgi:hypothetical protein